MKISKRIVSFCVVFTLIFSLFTAIPNVNLAVSADEILSNAIHIKTAEELKSIGGEASVGKYYVLDNDINLTSEWTPIDNFQGIFDGQGYTINNLYVSASSKREYAGLFGMIDASNVAIKNVGVNIGSQGISASSTTSSYNATYAGGLVGRSTNNNIAITITNCYATGNVSASSYAGGLIGSILYGEITNCYATGNVSVSDSSAHSVAGGLVGESYGTIKNCYATGNVFASSSFASVAGGLVGVSQNIITNCYRLSTQTVDGRTTNTSGTPLTDSQMKTQSSFVDWDFDTIWNYQGGVNNDYPILYRIAEIQEEPPTIITQSLPDGEVYTLYNQSLTATGTIPITWSIQSGNFPNGLTLFPNGVISGTPTTTGTFWFYINAINSDGTDTKLLSITITDSQTVTGIRLNPNNLTLDLWRNYTLIATVYPENHINKNVMWNSSNLNIVSVDSNGRVVARSVGTAIITATTIDGGYTDTCVINVTDIDEERYIWDDYPDDPDYGYWDGLYWQDNPVEAEYWNDETWFDKETDNIIDIPSPCVDDGTIHPITSSDIKRYTVLVLDISGSMKGKPLAELKKASKEFCDYIIRADSGNYISIVAYSSKSKIKQHFTNNYQVLANVIDSLKSGGSTNIFDGLSCAERLLDSVIANNSAVKQIFLMSDGLPNAGLRADTYQYSKSDYYNYRHANAVFNKSSELKSYGYQILTLGFFHVKTKSEFIPKRLRFAMRFMNEDLPSDEYRNAISIVNNPNDLVERFKEAARMLGVSTLSNNNRILIQNKLSQIPCDIQPTTEPYIPPYIPEPPTTTEWYIPPYIPEATTQSTTESSTQPNTESTTQPNIESSTQSSTEPTTQSSTDDKGDSGYNIRQRGDNNFYSIDSNGNFYIAENISDTDKDIYIVDNKEKYYPVIHIDDTGNIYVMDENENYYRIDPITKNFTSVDDRNDDYLNGIVKLSVMNNEILPKSGKFYLPLQLLIAVGLLGLSMLYLSIFRFKGEKRLKRKPRIFILCVGILSIISSTGVVAYGYFDDSRADTAVSQTIQILHEQIEQIQEYQESSEEYIDNTPKLIEINGESYIGTLKIPSLNLELPVNNKWNDEIMKNSPCRYMGDISSSMIIIAHNYKAHFGQIQNLLYGDKIVITDAKGKEHWYTVELTTILHETEIDAMINNPYDLTLFTCTLDRKHRITVRCNKINDENIEADNKTDKIIKINEETPQANIEISNISVNYPLFPEYDIKQGQKGGNVKLIQQYLNEIRIIQPTIPYLEEDGSFGSATNNAVKIFQKLYDLSVDGVVGQYTWGKMVEIYNSSQ